MDSVRLLNMAVFGLSLRTLNQIKRMVEIILCDAVQVNWTNIAHPDLNILLINDMFLDSSNIQRLLKNKDMKVLKLVAEQQALSTKARDSFCLIEMDQTFLKDWLLDNIHNTEKSSVDDATSIFQKTNTSTQPQGDIASIGLIQQVLNPANGCIKIFDRFGELAICDTRMQWVWINADREHLGTDLSINYTHATTNELQQTAMKQHHLQLWMWNILWNSADYLNLAPQQGYFKLVRWPQPELNSHHRDILKIATCFSLGAEINQVAKYLELPSTLVRQFIAASIILGFVEPITHTQATFTPKTEDEQQQPEVGKIKGFFSRLRAKLGL